MPDLPHRRVLPPTHVDLHKNESKNGENKHRKYDTFIKSRKKIMSCAEHMNQHQRKLRSRFDEWEIHSRIVDAKEKVLKDEKWKDVVGECE
jgi:hypothetical protein